MTFKDGLSFARDSLSALFFPPACTFCDSPQVDPRIGLCPDCSESVKTITGPVCAQCGLPVPGLPDEISGLCGQCLAYPPAFDRARYGVEYNGPIRKALVRFKYYGALHTGDTLSEILLQAFCRHFHAEQFDLILPIPIHTKRLISRGFNQSLILARALSADTGIPIDRISLRKSRDTPPQVGLTKSERVKNLRGSFSIRRPEAIRGRSILIVDDVSTTGSTIAEAAKTIKRSEAQQVDALVLALRPRIPMPQGSEVAVE